MITAPFEPCESEMLYAKVHIQVEPTIIDNTSNYDSSSLVNNENKKELVRLGAVGRRRAIVALPANILNSIAEISELKW
ncbi:hypothetical protein KXD40_000911 [Peronospora effusa]|uniref:Uncharacterized protein n=1 Tax=Peronospora effusa TaxID=542832 RepID=A0A3M6VHU3_9STRA|nr:hypothetical protein DD238_004765 [Peronospora effusa]RQM13023.1 hypothetical protein DD237_005261 [Peronospora effusa]UIZ21597.1 hypothetical protein KXD40_000911 [Peronospora effusa]CAI5724599.1 unnamed protein product [Peronospora effusa]